jgi:PAS domain S-box-containing protein
LYNSDIMNKSQKSIWDKGFQYIQSFERLFEQEDAFIFVKDLAGRVVYSNPSMINFYRYLGMDILGKDGSEFLPHYLADKIDRSDKLIFETGQPVYNIMERIPHKTGGYRWYIKNKVPLYDAHQQLVGICGMSRLLSEFDKENNNITSITPAVDYMMDHFQESLSIPDIARQVSLSVRQLNRHFKTTFGSTPQEYLTHIRVLKVCSLLKKTDHTLSAIAIKCGFHDQSHLTHRFKKLMNTTPAKYRNRH